MDPTFVLSAVALAALAATAPRAWRRLQLSQAKHPSLTGHSRMAKRVAGMIPGYTYDEAAFFASDDPPAELISRRKAGFQQLARQLREAHPKTLALSAQLRPHGV